MKSDPWSARGVRFDDATWLAALAHAELVRAIARGFQGRGHVLDLDDLTQEGLIGACRAVVGYDPSRGISLRAYVTICARKALCQAITDTGHTIRTYRKPRFAVPVVTPLIDVRVADHADTPVDHQPGPLDEAIASDEAARLRARVDRLMGRLTEDQRALVHLRYGLDGDSGPRLSPRGIRVIDRWVRRLRKCY